MAQDLKDIIEHLNTSGARPTSDPLQQICKILNAHMDSLQWIDQSLRLLQRKGGGGDQGVRGPAQGAGAQLPDALD